MKLQIVFRKLTNHNVGTIIHTPTKGVITIDLNAHVSPARIYLHELLHLYNPNRGERWVLDEERRIWKGMSQRQKHAMYQQLFRKQFRSQATDGFWED